ncbi:MAG TPA: PqiC family protein [Opitutaceae bacterium]|jgi:hypothetical protein
MKIPAPSPALAAACLLFLLAGCNVVPPPQEDPSRFYILSAPAAPAAPAAAPAAAGYRLALRAVRVDGYLHRREIVVRTGGNEVSFQDYRRWAEPLESSIGRVLRQELLAQPAVSQVLGDPLAVDAQPDFTISVEITQCEGEVSGGRASARFAAIVDVGAGGLGGRTLARRTYSAPAQGWDGKDYDRLAALLSSDVAGLARDIADSLAPAAP